MADPSLIIKLETRSPEFDEDVITDQLYLQSLIFIVWLLLLIHFILLR